MLSNKRFPVLTSLAPKLSRLGSANEEIGVVYQKYCVNSWMDNGFIVYSLNTAAEIDQLKHIYLDVHFIEAPRDGATVVGRPLVYIADMVKAMRDLGYEHCGIINSDIYIKDAPFLIDFLREEIHGSCIFGHRIDVNKLGDKKGSPYTMGFDYFFLEVDKFDFEAFSPFLQGVPWWDYGLPLMLGIQGVHLKRFESPTFFHLLHSQKWRVDSWRAYYRILRRMLSDLTCDSLDAHGLAAAPGFQGFRFMLGEGSFVSNYVGQNGTDTLEDPAIDRYICGFAYYCLEMIADMNKTVRLPSEDDTSSPIKSRTYTQREFEHTLASELV